MPPSRRRNRIVIVLDSDPQDRHATSGLIDTGGDVNVHAPRTWAEALAIIPDFEEGDCVICEVNLPGDGWEGMNASKAWSLIGLMDGVTFILYYSGEDTSRLPDRVPRARKSDGNRFYELYKKAVPTRC